MSDIKKAAMEIREMDALADMNSVIHSLNPLAKLIVTIVYIFITVSFDKYKISAILAMILYPAILFAFSGISIKKCFYKMRFAIPLVCVVGLFNPFFDRNIVAHYGTISISGGFISMISLMIKGILCLSASFLLTATTSIDKICMAFRSLHFPKFFVSLILLTYRYVVIMVEEVSIMTTAYQLRAPGQKGISFKAWGSFLGQMLLRSMDKAQDIYSGMLLRGFNGEFQYVENSPLNHKDIIYIISFVGIFVFFRLFNIANIIGNLFV